MTEQEIFDKVAKHLLDQGEPSVIGDSCVYRGTNGRMCAAGVLIPDEVYSVEMEGKCFHSVAQKLPDSLSYLKENSFFVGELQELHDDTMACTWERKLRAIASKRELNWNLG